MIHAPSQVRVGERDSAEWSVAKRISERRLAISTEEITNSSSRLRDNACLRNLVTLRQRHHGHNGHAPHVGIVLLIELLVCLTVRPAWTVGQVQPVYPAMLAGTSLTLTWTAHLGGSPTHRSDYLVRYHAAGPA